MHSMRFFMRLCEVHASEIDISYGYWVTHTGDVLHVPWQDHYTEAKWALQQIGYDVIATANVWHALRALGWVGVSIEDDNERHGHVINISHISPENMTLVATRTALQLLSRLGTMFDDIVGCRIDATERYNYGDAWFMPEVRRPVAQARQWIMTHSAKLAQANTSAMPKSKWRPEDDELLKALKGNDDASRAS